MQRIALVALALAAMATPAISSHSPADNLSRAQHHVNALDREIDQVRSPHIRGQLEERLDKIERLLNRIERSGALEGPPPGAYGPPGQYRPPPRHLSFDAAMNMVRAEHFDRDKLRTIQRVGASTRLTSRQARALAAELAFDNNQAEALIALYPAVTDKHRYRMTFDILDFGSSRRRVANTLGV